LCAFVVSERLLISIQPVIDCADVCLELGETDCVVGCKQTASRLRRLKRPFVAAHLRQNVDLMNSNPGSFGIQARAGDYRGGSIVETICIAKLARVVKDPASSGRGKSPRHAVAGESCELFDAASKASR